MKPSLVFLFVAFLSACSATPDNAQKSRALVVVPGMIGSSLVDAKGNMLWGGSSIFQTQFSRLDLPGSNWFADDGMKAKDVLDSLPLLPFVYSVDQYGALFSALEKAGFKRGENLFPYAYDWRQDLPSEAIKFRKFLQDLSLKHTIIDIYAISMGGMIALEALAEWNYTGLEVKHLVLAGTPFKGSPVAQRILHWPKRKGLRVSALAPTESALAMRSLYYLLPEQHLRKMWIDKNEEAAEFRYGDKLKNKHEALRVEDLDWIDARVYALAPKLAAEGLERAAAWRKRWNEPHRFPVVKRAAVFGSACEDTYGLPGDNTVLAESVDAAASALNTTPFWLCERHEKLQASRAVVENLIRYSLE